jgi:glycosyltransferase involved in cell wall biosynthesis
MSQPLISITIPTYNSKSTIEACLKGIRASTYKKFEIIIVDSNSKDATISIVNKYNVDKCIIYPGGLLGARLAGIRQAKGKYILLLDSDQILSFDTLANSVKKCESERYEMVALEEKVYQVRTFIEWLYAADRKLIETEKDYNPMTSAILPRFFSSNLLKEAISTINPKIIDSVGGPDHAIIYYEAYKICQRITSIPHAIFHIESNTLVKTIKKSYRWGLTGTSAKTVNEYNFLMQGKERFRKGLFRNGLVIESFASILLLLIKGIPYKIGYFKGKYLRK